MRGLAPADRDKGQLRRFLDLPGAQLDQIYSLARAALDLHDLDRAPGNLLPLLAQWIGWRTDHSLEVGEQRNEIRFAPQIYQTIGLIPTVEATVKRITGWESRTKEFVHNVARTNQPERLNLWSMVRSAGGNFGYRRAGIAELRLRRAAGAVRETDGTVSLFYHTHRRHGWDIWTKRFAGGQWQPSAPVVDQPSLDKHPAAALQGGRLWLFWENYDQTQRNADRKWRINFRTRVRSDVAGTATCGRRYRYLAIATARRSPTAVIDNAGGALALLARTNGHGMGRQVQPSRRHPMVGEPGCTSV